MAEKSHEAKAGAPKTMKAAGGAKTASARAALPTEAQLDDRDWHKAGPRRMAGPPLGLGAPGPAAEALAARETPAPTDPK